jgi:lysozyme
MSTIALIPAADWWPDDAGEILPAGYLSPQCWIEETAPGRFALRSVDPAKKNRPLADGETVVFRFCQELGMVELEVAADGTYEVLDRLLTAAAKSVLACSPELRVRPNQLGPAVDFAYNAGVGAWCKSAMARRFEAGDWGGGCAAFSQWIYAGGKVLPGLVKRRAAERALCEKGL